MRVFQQLQSNVLLTIKLLSKKKKIIQNSQIII